MTDEYAHVHAVLLGSRHNNNIVDGYKRLRQATYCKLLQLTFSAHSLKARLEIHILLLWVTILQNGWRHMQLHTGDCDLDVLSILTLHCDQVKKFESEIL